MKKIQIFVGFFLVFGVVLQSWADNSVKIISRKQWGADETLRYLSSPEWKSILQKREEIALEPLTDGQKAQREIEKQRQEEISSYFTKNFSNDITSVETIKYENGEELAWPIKKTNTVKSIVIHHTDTNYGDDIESLQKIYRFHAITRGWGDIGYNYLIGKDGDIYEGRAGGDYVVAAHALYNNSSTVSISIIGQYDSKGINEKQYAALSKMVTYLSKKYGIDLNKKVYFHKECKGSSCTSPITSFLKYPIVGHRDVGYTTCPGDELYGQIQDILKENQEKTKGFSLVAYKTSFKKQTVKAEISSKKLEESLLKTFKTKTYTELLDTLEKTENSLFYDKNTSGKVESLMILQKSIVQYLKSFEKIEKKQIRSYDDTHTVKIKLSYPQNNTISLDDGVKKYIVSASGTLLTVGGKDFSKLELSSKKRGYIEISSWKRVQTWDSEGKYNDNKFRGKILLRSVDGKIEVVNELPITDYLKGLGEVNDSDEEEKIKTIIIAARTYVRYYTQLSKKFPGKNYDGSDDPDEFQRYLGYEYEKRSPKVSKYVDDTKDKVIVYDDTIIKPWYFHSSDGVTKSYLQYCQEKGTKKETCLRESLKYPFLKARKDWGSVGSSFSGHGVGISGKGATFLAQKGWSASMIISYYLKGTSVKMKNF